MTAFDLEDFSRLIKDCSNAREENQIRHQGNRNDYSKEDENQN